MIFEIMASKDAGAIIEKLFDLEMKNVKEGRQYYKQLVEMLNRVFPNENIIIKGGNSEEDILIHTELGIPILIEFKRIVNPEFFAVFSLYEYLCIKEIAGLDTFLKENKIGNLTKKQVNQLLQYLDGKGKFPTAKGDGIAQLRLYSLKRLFATEEKKNISIITNGTLWMIFGFKKLEEISDNNYLTSGEIITAMRLPKEAFELFKFFQKHQFTWL